MFTYSLDHQNRADSSARVGPRLLRNCRDWSGVAPIATHRRRPMIPTALMRPRTPTHGTPRRRPYAIDGKSVIAIAAIAANSPQALTSIPPSHGYVSAASHESSDGE